MTDESNRYDPSKIIFGFACYFLGIICLWSAFVLSTRAHLHEIDHFWFFSIDDISRWLDIGEYVPSPYILPILFIAAILLLFVGYAVLLRTSYNCGDNNVFRRRIAIAAIVVAVLFMLLPPYLSTDHVSYYQLGWIFADKHANPYIMTPADFDDTPLIHSYETRTEGLVSPYGPLWTHISALIVLLSGNNGIVGLICYKIIALAVYAISFVVCRRIAETCCDLYAYPALVLVFFNPLFLLEGPGVAHNDGFAIMITLIGLWLYLRSNRFLWIGLVVMFLGALIKAFALPAFLLALVHWAKRDDLKHKSWIHLILVFSICGLILYVLSHPFVDSPGQLGQVLGFTKVTSAYDLPLVPAIIARDILLLLAKAVGLAINKAIITRIVIASFYLAGAVIAAVLVFRARNAWQILTLLAPCYAIGTIIMHYWRQWYVMWPVAFCIFRPGKSWVRTLIILYSILALATYLLTRSSEISFNINRIKPLG
jgi:hypothetical protein